MENYHISRSFISNGRLGDIRPTYKGSFNSSLCYIFKNHNSYIILSTQRFFVVVMKNKEWPINSPSYTYLPTIIPPPLLSHSTLLWLPHTQTPSFLRILSSNFLKKKWKEKKCTPKKSKMHSRKISLTIHYRAAIWWIIAMNKNLWAPRWTIQGHQLEVGELPQMRIIRPQCSGGRMPFAKTKRATSTKR